MRSLLAVLMLVVAGTAWGQVQSPKCNPGTTPFYYRITFAGTPEAAVNGKTYWLRQTSENTWVSEMRSQNPFGLPWAGPAIVFNPPLVPPIPGKAGGRREVTFYHGGSLAPIPFAGYGGGLFTSPHSGIGGFTEVPSRGTQIDIVATAEVRNGGGPFVIPLAGGGTATVQP